jgi:tetratricopeptide (TPR) repeat protein
VALLALLKISDLDRSRVQVEHTRMEEERNRAEAEYQVSRAALAEVIKVGGWGVQSPIAIRRNDLIASLANARRHIVELAVRRPNDRAIRSLLAEADLYLGRNLDLEEKLAEALPIHLESLSLWEKLLQECPDDLSAMYNQWRSLVCLAVVFERQGQLAESRRHWERALSVGEKTFPLFPDYNTMMQCRSRLARLVHDAGDHKRAQALLEANLRMLMACSEKARTAEIEQLLSQTRQQIQRFDSSLQPASMPPPASPKSTNSLCSFLLSKCDCLTSEERAEILMGQLFSGPTTSIVDGSESARMLALLVESLISQTLRMRHTGKLNEARLAADRMVGFGRLLVGQHADQPRAHLILSEAYFQVSKNCWCIDDRAAVERNLRLAIASANRALTLDSNSHDARHCVEARQRRLDMLVGGVVDLQP